MKFSALTLTADFSSPCVDPVGSKRGTPLKTGYFIDIGASRGKQLQIGINMLLIITSTSDGLFSGIDIDDLVWPWNPKTGGFSVFCDFLAAVHTSIINCNKNGWRQTICEQELLRLSRVSWALLKLLVFFQSRKVDLQKFVSALHFWCSKYSRVFSVFFSAHRTGRAVVKVVIRPSVCPSWMYTVAKRCKIGPTLLLITNKKSHTGFQMIYKSMTFDDLEGRYARSSTKNWPHLWNSKRDGL